MKKLLLFLSLVSVGFSQDVTLAGNSWNLIGINYKSSDSSGFNINDINNNSGSFVTVFDGSKTWSSSNPGSTRGLTTFSEGKAFWIYTSKSTIISIDETYGLIDKPNLNLNQWNLVSFPVSESTEIVSYNFGTGIQPLKIFNGSKTWTYGVESARGLNTLEPGKGYWVYVSESNASIALENPPSFPPLSGLPAPEQPSVN